MHLKHNSVLSKVVYCDYALSQVRKGHETVMYHFTI